MYKYIQQIFDPPGWSGAECINIYNKYLTYRDGVMVSLILHSSYSYQTQSQSAGTAYFS